MKRIAIALISALFVLGMVSCQQSNSPDGDGAEGTTVGTDGQTADASTPNATSDTENSATKKPGYQEKAEAMAKTTIEWVAMEHDFGQVTDGEIVRHSYTFKNTGSEPLVLQRAKASCGCTTPHWTKEPIAPGAEGIVDVEFNTKNKPGMQTKTVTVTGNFEGGINQVLKIRGEVLAAATN